MKKKKLLTLLILVFTVLLVACGGDDNGDAIGNDGESDTGISTNDEVDNNDNSSGNDGGAIAVVSREDGSGARSAFEELVGVNIDEDNMMTSSAIIQNGNGVVATFVTENPAAIGYISFATFLENSDALTGLYIDGVAPTTDNMLSGAYTLVRPFNFVYMPNEIGIVEEAFIAFATSIEGLDILTYLGAVVDHTEAQNFDFNDWDLPAGTVSFGGSTSTEATAMALVEEFTAMFPQVEITYESVGSGAGITGATEGTFSLGFASREIRDTELETGLNFVTYCVDGIVIVVNPANGVTQLTVDEIHRIYLGEITDWAQIQ